MHTQMGFRHRRRIRQQRVTPSFATSTKLEFSYFASQIRPEVSRSLALSRALSRSSLDSTREERGKNEERTREGHAQSGQFQIRKFTKVSLTRFQIGLPIIFIAIDFRFLPLLYRFKRIKDTRKLLLPAKRSKTSRFDEIDLETISLSSCSDRWDQRAGSFSYLFRSTITSSTSRHFFRSNISLDRPSRIKNRRFSSNRSNLMFHL